MGIGSFLTDNLHLNSRARIVAWGIVTGVYTVALTFCMGPAFAAFNDSTLAVRIVLCVALIAPAGISLGFGFPTGMRLVSSIDAKPTPWFWGINGAAGVLASISAVVVSLALGITATVLVGALCYFLLIPVALTFLQPLNNTVPKKLRKPQAVSRKAPKTSSARQR